jgi:hypothetical protein
MENDQIQRERRNVCVEAGLMSALFGWIMENARAEKNHFGRHV